MVDCWNVGQVKRRHGETETRRPGIKTVFSPYPRISLSPHQHTKRRYKNVCSFQSSKKPKALPYPCH
jgi:hypothetical protein